LGDNGIRRGRPTAGGVKKCPVDTFLGRGRIHRIPTASGRDVGGILSFLGAYGIRK